VRQTFTNASLSLSLSVALYSRSPAGGGQGTFAKWLFHQEKAAMNDVRKGS